MANIKSAKKRIIQTSVRTERNRARVSRIRSFVRKVEEAITGGNKENAKDALRTAESEMMRGVTKGVLQLKTVSRRVSRLSARVKSI